MYSQEYQQQLQDKHAKDDNWGTTSHRYAALITEFASTHGLREILDYGCGKGALKQNMPESFTIKEYDPGIPQKSKKPKPAQMVVCTDVLEHVEPNYLNQVLDDLHRVTEKIGFFDVCMVPAIHTLPDGRNAHLIVEDSNWWLEKILQRFKLHAMMDSGSNFWVLVSPL